MLQKHKGNKTINIKESLNKNMTLLILSHILMFCLSI